MSRPQCGTRLIWPQASPTMSNLCANRRFVEVTYRPLNNAFLTFFNLTAVLTVVGSTKLVVARKITTSVAISSMIYCDAAAS